MHIHSKSWEANWEGGKWSTPWGRRVGLLADQSSRAYLLFSQDFQTLAAAVEPTLGPHLTSPHLTPL